MHPSHITTGRTAAAGLGAAALVAGALAIPACGSAPPSAAARAAAAAAAVPLTPAQVAYQASRQRMRDKFGPIKGAELVVDAMAGQELYGVEFFPEHSDRQLYAKSLQSLTTRTNMSMPLEIAERVRVVWRKSDAHPIIGRHGEMTYADPIIGTELVEVGSRIPQEVIDDLKRERGGLRLKFRLSHEGVYFGWDIDRRPGYNPNRLDAFGKPYYAPPVHSMVGGDFREAELTNGKVVRRGWYINKKTGQRIETDY